MRRIWMPLVLVASLSGCWVQFRGDAAHTGAQPLESVVGVANVSTLADVWTVSTTGGISSSPAVVSGVAYVGSSDHRLYASDATGAVGCSGTPKVCAPLWTATTGDVVNSSPAVASDANGVVFVGSADAKLYAFDSAGTTGCSGVPKTCVPLWTATAGGPVNSSPTVSSGVVYVGSADAKVYAFDAAGTTGCSGVPKVCAPLWTATTGGAVNSSPAVAIGVVYVGSTDAKVYAFDAAGTTGCSGGPKVCAPLWTATTGGAVGSSPAVANGVVYVGSTDAKLYAFDAAGTTGCSGAPKTCTPLFTGTTGGGISSSPAVVSGRVYVGSADGKLHVFGLAGPSSTTTALSANPNPVAFGSNVTFTATVTSSGGTPSGTVTFKDGGSDLGTGTLSAGQATFGTSSLSVGTHTMTATYGGATDFATSTSPPLSEVVSSSGATLRVTVGYYDTHHSGLPQPKPGPWLGSPGVVFAGLADPATGGWDTAAVKIDNLTGAPITGVTVRVDIGSNTYSLWGTNTIPAGQSLILAQTGYENFDGSDHHTAGCYGCNPNLCTTAVDSRVPVVHVTVGTTTSDYRDTGLLLSTGGVDRAGCPYTGTRNDESEQWQPIST